MKHASLWTRLLLAAVTLLAVGSCQTVQTTSPGTVGVDRKQTMLLSSDEVNRGAQAAYSQAITETSRKGALNRDAAQVARVRAITTRLIPATATFRKDAPGWKWEVNVISSKEVNAWCMPGGKIAVYTGMLDTLRVTDDELAAVLGHEIAHALREHGRERASQQVAQGAVIGIGGALLGLGETATDLAQVISHVTLTLPNSREHEREADRIGVELAARAGYDPRAAVTLWQKMGQVGGGQPPQFLSTHPSTENRVRDLQNYAAQVLPLYESARGGRR
jgi:predicted Zn-dependent protease